VECATIMWGASDGGRRFGMGANQFKDAHSDYAHEANRDAHLQAWRRRLATWAGDPDGRVAVLR
jgi:hypothetical protein